LDERWDRDRGEKVHTAVALFAALVALGIAGLGWLCRFGFADNSPREWAKFVGLSWFLLFFSLVVRTLLGIKGGPGPWRSWTSHAGLTLAGLALLALVGVEWGAAARNGANLAALARGSEAALFVLGGAGFVLGFWAVVRSARLRDTAALLAFAALFSVYGAGASSGNGYQNPLFVEGICFNYCQIDELYHAGLCNMLRTYGVSSTGLDGLPFVAYHWGSHWLFAQLCNVLDVRVIDFYTRGYRVVFVPLGVLSLGTFAASAAWPRCRWSARARWETVDSDLEQTGRIKPSDRSHPFEGGSWPIGPLFWLIVWTGYVSFLPYPPFLTPIYAWSSIVVSESYAVGVAVSLFALAWAWFFFQDVRDRGNRWSLNVVVGAVFLAALMAGLALLKVSQVTIVAAVGAYFYLRLGWYRSSVLGVLLAAGVAGAYCARPLIVSPMWAPPGSEFPLFGFVRNCVDPQWWPYFWLFYYAWLWVVAAVRFREERIRTLRDLVPALRARKVLDLEFLLVAALTGFVPAMLFVPYSSGQFFAEYQQWLAMGIVLSIVACRAGSRHEAPVASASPFSWTTWADRLSLVGRVPISRIFLGAVLVSVAGMALFNTLTLAARMVNEDAVCRGHAGGGTGVNAALMHGRFREAAGILDKTAKDVERRFDSDKNVLELLRALDEMPLSQKRASLLFIPKSNRQFWQLVHGPRWPLDGPLVAPALSGVAMIDGLCVPKKDGEWVAFGYSCYPQPDPARRQPPLDEYLPILRSRCAGMGFKQLIVIDTDKDGRSREQRYDCP